jgi:predicted metal-binding protein
MPIHTPIIITICTTCRLKGTERDQAQGKTLMEAIESAALDAPQIMVRQTQCLSVCDRVCTVSLSGEGRYTFLFGDLDAANDAQAIVDMAQACALADHGFVPWKDRPERLRKAIIARIPPPGWSPLDGSAPA